MPTSITKKDLIDWGSASLVFLSGAMTGHYAAIGMNAVQWAGSLAAIVGSVTVAVAVRVWPSKSATANAED